MSVFGDGPGGGAPPGLRVEIPGLVQGAQQPQQPQRKVDEFWRNFTSKTPGKATTLLPRNELAERLAKRSAAKDLAGGSTKTTTTSYEEAAALCRAKVDQIVAECRRINQKYRDPHFDLDYDLRSGLRDCLESLSNDRAVYASEDESDTTSSSSRSRSRSTSRRRSRRAPDSSGSAAAAPGGTGGGDGRDSKKGGRRRGDASAWPGNEFSPRSVKRVGEIFDDPKFYIDGPTANDVRQGRDGDCWLMAALCTLSNKPGLIERVCIARNEDVGVYGFVFHRDGEWISEIIDDKLYLIKPDYDELRLAGRFNFDRALWEQIDRPDSEEDYRKAYQANSAALYFAQCEDPNETWLPLLEKAYAKAHGDYAAIEGGYTGEGIEDLTGGVTTELFTTNILDKEYFWKEELMKVNKDFLFGCSTGLWGLGYGERKGIQESHAYSVMRAVEIDGERLVLLKNPWGKGEWTGAWSDGSKEWTPEWLTKLNHRFGDDGAFWISYKDLLRKYQNFERTRLFGPEWKITSLWTTLNVSWSLEYHDTKFSFSLAKPGPVVVVLSQLDDRYFRGLEGQYIFGLGFRVHKAGEDDYLVRTHTSYRINRSCNVELDLEAGEYTVLIRLDAERVDGVLPPEDVVQLNVKDRREKLLRIGLAYDLAHSKARIVETAEEKAAREAYKKRKKEKRYQHIRKVIMDDRKKRHYFKVKEWTSQRKDVSYKNEVVRKRAERRKAKKAGAREEAKQDETAAAEKGEDATSPKDTQQVETRSPEEGQAEGKSKEVAEQETQPDGNLAAEGERTQKVPANDEQKADESQPTTEAPEKSQSPENDSKVEDAPQEGEALPADEAESAQNTPAASTSDKSSSAPAGAQHDPDTVAKDVAAEEPAGTAPAPAGETVAEEQSKPAEGEASDLDWADAPEEAQVSQDSAPDAEGDGRSSGPNTHFKQRIKAALQVVSSFQRELSGLLGDDHANSEDDDQADSEDGRLDIQDFHPQTHHRRPHDPPRRHRGPHGPPHHHGPRGFRGPHGPPHHHGPHNFRGPPGPPGPHGPRRFPGPPPRPRDEIRVIPVNGGASGIPTPPGPPSSRGGFPGRGAETEEDEPEGEDLGVDEDDDICSIRSVSELSDTELDYIVKENEDRPGGGRGAQPPVMGMGPMVASGGQSADGVESDPWNAVAVVGLRIYYKVAEEDREVDGLVKMKVVRPNRWELSDEEEEEEGEGEEGGQGDEGGGEKEGGEGEEEGADETQVLDVDDSCKDATVKVV